MVLTGREFHPHVCLSEQGPPPERVPAAALPVSRALSCWLASLPSLRNVALIGVYLVLVIMYGCSRVTIDPRIPTMPGWSTSVFH